MSMSKKDYVAIAKVIRAEADRGVSPANLAAAARIADGLAEHFADDNLFFDRNRFFDAALGPNIRP